MAGQATDPVAVLAIVGPQISYGLAGESEPRGRSALQVALCSVAINNVETGVEQCPVALELETKPRSAERDKRLWTALLEDILVARLLLDPAATTVILCEGALWPAHAQSRVKDALLRGCGVRRVVPVPLEAVALIGAGSPDGLVVHVGTRETFVVPVSGHATLLEYAAAVPHDEHGAPPLDVGPERPASPESLPGAILRAVAQLPMDLRVPLARRLLLVGPTAAPGLRGRILRALDAASTPEKGARDPQARPTPYISCQRAVARQFAFLEAPADVALVGASLLGALVLGQSGSAGNLAAALDQLGLPSFAAYR